MRVTIKKIIVVLLSTAAISARDQIDGGGSGPLTDEVAD